MKPDPPGSTPPLQATITVATYNIHQCIGNDGQCDMERIARVIREIGPDIIGLQEVDSPSLPSERPLQMEYLAGAVDMTAIPGPTLRRPNVHYGNVLLTRLPVRRVDRLDISVNGREPRGAIDALLSHPSGPLRVISTHFGLYPRERFFQAERIYRWLTHSDETDPTILLGDINEWLTRSRMWRHFHRYFDRPPVIRTFPARFPLFALDRIWIRPGRVLNRIRAHRSSLARQASDHLPLVAEISLG